MENDDATNEVINIENDDLVLNEENELEEINENQKKSYAMWGIVALVCTIGAFLFYFNVLK
ncbi:MAG: hypothetical protein ACPGC9_01440 [Cytophagales bacterium]